MQTETIVTATSQYVHLFCGLDDFDLDAFALKFSAATGIPLTQVIEERDMYYEYIDDFIMLFLSTHIFYPEELLLPNLPFWVRLRAMRRNGANWLELCDTRNKFAAQIYDNLCKEPRIRIAFVDGEDGVIGIKS